MNEAARRGKWQRAQHDRIENAEDGGVCTDAERESKYCDGGEAGRFAQHPKCEVQVLHEYFEKANAACVAKLFVDLVARADSKACTASRFVKRNARGREFFDLLVKMETQFVVQTGFDRIFSKQRTKTQAKISQHLQSPKDAFEISPLFVAQRDQGIDLHCAPRGNVAREESHAAKEKRRSGKSWRVHRTHSKEQSGKQRRQREGKGNANQTSEHHRRHTAAQH